MIVEARGVTKRFGARVAVDGIDLDVAAGRLLRPARAERRRQDHHAAHDLRRHAGRPPASIRVFGIDIAARSARRARAGSA